MNSPLGLSDGGTVVAEGDVASPFLEVIANAAPEIVRLTMIIEAGGSLHQ